MRQVFRQAVERLPTELLPGESPPDRQIVAEGARIYIATFREINNRRKKGSGKRPTYTGPTLVDYLESHGIRWVSSDPLEKRLEFCKFERVIRRTAQRELEGDRVCIYDGCDTSLAGEYVKRQYCLVHSGVRDRERDRAYQAGRRTMRRGR